MYETIDSNLSDCNVGNRKGRNIRDHLFVLNAILNSTKRKTEEAVDIGVYDVQKCFDTLWANEALNDAYELGLNNDKLPLVYMSNKNASIAITSSIGTSKRININNTIMQGTVWAGMLCTGTLDKLGKLVYDNDQLAYKYRGKVVVPPLEMVDDVLTVSKCRTTGVAMNTLVNSFFNSKKIKLNQSKCAKIHVGKKCDHCPQYYAQGNKMNTHVQEKYLGDIIHSDGKQHATIVERLARGYGILANIKALLDDIPLGHRRIELGFELRQAWLINGLLYNSEVWQNITEKDKTDLNKIDHILLRSIIGSHGKAPIEQLYLETGSLNLTQIISTRRMIYLKNILHKSESELVRQVYDEMKADPIEGDWCLMVKKDFEESNIQLNEDQVRQMDHQQFKTLIKKGVRDSSFIHFKEKQANHQKGRFLEHEDLTKPQPYLITNKLTNKQIGLLFNLRCQSVWGIRDNFHNLYEDRMCQLCFIEVDNQKHILLCSTLMKHMKTNSDIQYEGIYSELQVQIPVTILFSALLELRERLLTGGAGLPGHLIPDSQTL